MAPKKAVKGTTTFNRRVLRIVRSTQERKMKVFNLSNTQHIPGSGIKFDDGTQTTHSGIVVAPLAVCALAQGTSKSERIGNKIQNVYLNCRGFVHSKPYDAATNPSAFPYEVHVIAYKNKHDRAGDFTRLKQGLNNVQEEISGSAMSSLRPWNKEEYQIKFHRWFKLNSLTEVTDSANSLLNPQVGQHPPMRRFSYKIPIAKNLVYRDGENVPQNDWVHVGVYIVECSGDELGSNIERATLQMDGYLTFQDA